MACGCHRELPGRHRLRQRPQKMKFHADFSSCIPAEVLVSHGDELLLQDPANDQESATPKTGTTCAETPTPADAQSLVMRFGYVVNIQELNVREQTKLQVSCRHSFRLARGLKSRCLSPSRLHGVFSPPRSPAAELYPPPAFHFTIHCSSHQVFNHGP